jgi:hypothetical protein
MAIIGYTHGVRLSARPPRKTNRNVTNQPCTRTSVAIGLTSSFAPAVTRRARGAASVVTAPKISGWTGCGFCGAETISVSMATGMVFGAMQT